MCWISSNILGGPGLNPVKWTLCKASSLPPSLLISILLSLLSLCHLSWCPCCSIYNLSCIPYVLSIICPGAPSPIPSVHRLPWCPFCSIYNLFNIPSVLSAICSGAPPPPCPGLPSALGPPLLIIWPGAPSVHHLSWCLLYASSFLVSPLFYVSSFTEYYAVSDAREGQIVTKENKPNQEITTSSTTPLPPTKKNKKKRRK